MAVSVGAGGEPHPAEGDRVEQPAPLGGSEPAGPHAGIDKREFGVPGFHPTRQVLGRHHVVGPLARHERIAALPRSRRQVVERQAGLAPAVQAPVEHGGRLVPEVAQQPPQPSGAALAGLVVGHDGAVGADARARGGGGERVCTRERVAAARAGPGRRRELLLHVEEVRARDVRLVPRRESGAWRAERPPAIDHDEPLLPEAIEQPIGRDERSERHASEVTLWPMRAMVLEAARTPLRLLELQDPEPAAGQVLLEVHACAVCRTDLHVVDGELPRPKLPLVLGHQIVGHVLASGGGAASRFEPGERVGAPWLGWTDGTCRYCSSGRENLCDHARFTGYDLDGGYAEQAVADERFCFRIPDGYHDLQAAPLLCAGLIGYRALTMAGDAERLGLYGFGAAAHIVAQVALHEGRRVFAFTRAEDEESQAFARSLGAEWAGDAMRPGPEELDAAIVFAPVGGLVPAALRATAKGGVVVCAGIHMSDIPSFPYELLWGERVLRSVANLTREDGERFMALAPTVPVRTEVEAFPLAEANRALERLRSGAVRGAVAIIPGESTDRRPE